MSVSIKRNFKHHPTQEQTDLQRVMNAVLTDLAAMRDALVANKALYDVHTHEAPGTTYAASRTSTPDTGAAENSLTASAASEFTTPAVLSLVE